jgi:hypothetical protein
MIDNDFNANGEGRPASPVKKDAPKFQKPLTKLIFIAVTAHPYGNDKKSHQRANGYCR